MSGTELVCVSECVTIAEVAEGPSFGLDFAFVVASVGS